MVFDGEGLGMGVKVYGLRVFVSVIIGLGVVGWCVYVMIIVKFLELVILLNMR